MTAHDHDSGDIDDIIAQTKKAEHAVWSAPEKEMAAKNALDYVRAYSGKVIELLLELKERRNFANCQGDEGTHYTTRVEGVSDVSAAEAFSFALGKAARYFSENCDVTLILERLVTLPGGGHRAVVEVRMTPLTWRYRPHVKNMDIQLKRIHDHESHIDRLREEEAIPHLIFDHFSRSHSAAPAHVPPFFLVNINDAGILNHMLEKEFLKAGEAFKPEPGVRHILVRTQDPEPD